MASASITPGQSSLCFARICLIFCVYARSLGLVTSLITNGRLLAQRANELGDLDYLSVSVDGIKSYRELRGIDLQDTIAGIKAAKEAGHEVLMNCVINSKNVSELEDLVHLAESLGTMISFEPLHESSGIDETVWGTLGIRDLPRYEKAVQRLIELKRDGAPIINSETYLEMIKTLQPRFKCHASDIILHVASDGTMENCRVHQEPLGNVSEGIARVWKSSQRETQRDGSGMPGLPVLRLCGE